MATIYLGLGSNLGNKEEQLIQALQILKERIGPMVACSAFFTSEPWGFESEHVFLNACAAFQTDRSPFECMTALQGVEQGMGRLKTWRGEYKDRVIDLDILFYDQTILTENDLVVPHPLLHKRSFVLQPLVEIAPDFVHPVLHKTVSELLAGLNGQS